MPERGVLASPANVPKIEYTSTFPCMAAWEHVPETTEYHLVVETKLAMMALWVKCLPWKHEEFWEDALEAYYGIGFLSV